MYGKIFSSMFEGSMVGSGAITFAIMSYVIANFMPDREVGAQVELNPKLLAFILGEEEEMVKASIDKLCAPDPDSRTKGHDGRRLIRLGQFSYQVVNGEKYRAIRDEEQRRKQNREAQQRRRLKLKETYDNQANGAQTKASQGNGSTPVSYRSNRHSDMGEEA